MSPKEINKFISSLETIIPPNISATPRICLTKRQMANVIRIATGKPDRPPRTVLGYFEVPSKDPKAG